MSPFDRDGDYARRSCRWTFGLLMLIGLAACGASDQAVGANPANATSTGVPQQASPASESDPPPPAPQPTTLPNSTGRLPTPALRRRPSTPPIPPQPLKPTTASAPTAAAGSTGGWQSYRNAQAGFSVTYPPDWTASEQISEDGASITAFSPAGGGPGIKIVMQLGALPATRQPESSDRICERVTVGRLVGMRCLDANTAIISATLAGKGRTYSIATTGKGVDAQIYQRLLDNFAPAD